MGANFLQLPRRPQRQHDACNDLGLVFIGIWARECSCLLPIGRRVDPALDRALVTILQRLSPPCAWPGD
eukprot:10324267-Lingulodinium_polyedra.AAC.1